jgi:hypothetical protein
MIRRLAKSIVIGLVLVGTSTAVTAHAAEITNGVNPRATVTYSVPATQPWSDTGLTVRSGLLVTIAATGTIQVNLGGTSQTPNGQGGSPGCVGDSTFTAPGLACWSLIGRIDNGAPFEVGTLHSFSVPAGGHLYLGVNDQVNGFWDNSGSWTATIFRF